MTTMLKRSLVTLLVVAACSPMLVASAGATSAPPYRPDALIKLCGVNTGCLIDPLPHPWFGNDIYNATAYHQTVHHRLDNGRGIRFWINFQNDGTQTDTYSLQGCTGNKDFKILAVLVGKYKYPIGVEAEHITWKFIHNTWKFTLKPGAHIVITLNFLTVDAKDVGLTYRCPMTITSKIDPTKHDTVAAVMTTY